jgi:hypothetical protein
MNAHPDNTVFLAVTATMRKRLQATIENLIALMDEIDGDENLEESGDEEASLGWPERGPGAAGGHYDDREADDADDEDGGDTELNGDELDFNGDETDYDGGENDPPGLIWGGQGA